MLFAEAILEGFVGDLQEFAVWVDILVFYVTSGEGVYARKMFFVELTRPGRVCEDASEVSLWLSLLVTRIWIDIAIRILVLYWPSSPMAVEMGELNKPNLLRSPILLVSCMMVARSA